MYNIIYEMSRQSRFDARYWILGAGALGRPRGMVRGRRREEGSGWGTRVYLWWIHVATSMHTHPLDPMYAVWLISLKMFDVVSG